MASKRLTLSASAISAFRVCPMKFYLGYVLGVRKKEDPDAFRMGTNWHSLLEMLGNDPDDTTFEKVVATLNVAYDVCPDNKDPQAWELEREKLLQAIIAYQWYFKNRLGEYETIAAEIPFQFDVGDGFVIKGRVDKLLRDNNGHYAIQEHKSTSKDVGSGSVFWDRISQGLQPNLYLYALGKEQKRGKLRKYGLQPTGDPIQTVIYDVWKKPGINPKQISKANVNKLVKKGEYCGKTFDVQSGDDGILYVNNRCVTSINSDTAKNYESPELYGARLLADLSERPEYYFAWKEITRSMKEVEQFHEQFMRLCSTIYLTRQFDLWYYDETQCDAMYRCEYCPICIERGGAYPTEELLDEWSGTFDVFYRERLNNADATTPKQAD